MSVSLIYVLLALLFGASSTMSAGEGSSAYPAMPQRGYSYTVPPEKRAPAQPLPRQPRLSFLPHFA